MKWKHSLTSKHIYIAMAIVLVFFFGSLFGYFLSQKISMDTLQVQRANDPRYSYINPLLSCGISENKEFSEYKSLETKINKVLAQVDHKKVSSVSVYYRELNSGKWFGVNENETYSPASLMKVPVMIAYLKDSEDDKETLGKYIYYSGSNALTSNNEYYKSPTQIAAGGSYSVDSLIKAMVEHSDNAAADLLYNNMDPNSLDEVLTDIGIRLPNGSSDPGTEDFLTVKSYSYLFRLLYNSTYLNRDDSEEALDILTKTDFDKGLRGGVPTSIPIAHKFGERTVLNNDGTLEVRELHDCGIVYYPGDPYLLCVMTKGTDFDSLSNAIKPVSETVFEDVKSTAK